MLNSSVEFRVGTLSALRAKALAINRRQRSDNDELPLHRGLNKHAQRLKPATMLRSSSQ